MKQSEIRTGHYEAISLVNCISEQTTTHGKLGCQLAKQGMFQAEQIFEIARLQMTQNRINAVGTAIQWEDFQGDGSEFERTLELLSSLNGKALVRDLTPGTFSRMAAKLPNLVYNCLTLDMADKAVALAPTLTSSEAYAVVSIACKDLDGASLIDKTVRTISFVNWLHSIGIPQQRIIIDVFCCPLFMVAGEFDFATNCIEALRRGLPECTLMVAANNLLNGAGTGLPRAVLLQALTAKLMAAGATMVLGGLEYLNEDDFRIAPLIGPATKVLKNPNCATLTAFAKLLPKDVQCPAKWTNLELSTDKLSVERHAREKYIESQTRCY